MITIAADPKHLGARIGVLSVLHTWGSALTHHPHVHMIVPGGEGPERYGVMTLDTHEFIRRFLMHVLPQGFHRIRYYGLLTSQTRAKNIARVRELLAVPLIPIDAIKAANPKASTSAQPEEPKPPEHPCPCCGSRMLIIETFLRGQQPKHRPTPVPPKITIDTS
jgi:hypothetical protein